MCLTLLQWCNNECYNVVFHTLRWLNCCYIHEPLCMFFFCLWETGQAVKTYSVEQTPHPVCTWSYIHWRLPYSKKHLVRYRKRNARHPKVFFNFIFSLLADQNEMTNIFQVMWNKYYRIKAVFIQFFSQSRFPLAVIKNPFNQSCTFYIFILDPVGLFWHWNMHGQSSCIYHTQPCHLQKYTKRLTHSNDKICCIFGVFFLLMLCKNILSGRDLKRPFQDFLGFPLLMMTSWAQLCAQLWAHTILRVKNGSN